MPDYYVNDTPQSNGDHEVHTSACTYLPGAGNRTYVGNHSSCHSAVERAKQIYRKSNGCFTCSRPCHTG